MMFVIHIIIRNIVVQIIRRYKPNISKPEDFGIPYISVTHTLYSTCWLYNDVSLVISHQYP